jgi:hypothetical protein
LTRRVALEKPKPRVAPVGVLAYRGCASNGRLAPRIHAINRHAEGYWGQGDLLRLRRPGRRVRQPGPPYECLIIRRVALILAVKMPTEIARSLDIAIGLIELNPRQLLQMGRLRVNQQFVHRRDRQLADQP